MEDERDSRYKNKTFIVPIIKSFDHYDFARAKIACSLTWLVAKAFGSDCIPEELEETFYKDQYDQEHLKPPVASLLLSAELYCRAGSLILRSDAARPLLGHNGVIQALAQKGLYVTDQERLVTERDLCKTPIQMSSHLAMIDTLMMAYTLEMISVERVLTCVQKYSPFFPEEDFPYDAEEAVTIWFNKVNGYLRETITCAQRVGKSLQDKPAGKKYNKEDLKPQPLLYLPLVDNLLKDNTDGCALAALLHFYCPNAVPLEDICMKETMSLADSLYNLQLVQDFCRKNLNNCCHFTLEDMLYASSSIKCNYLVFMAELFWWFEVVKPSFVEPRKLESKVEATKMTKCDLMHRLPSPNSPKSPNLTNSDMMKRSNTLSYDDRCVGTWPKEKRSSGHGISFDIPFDDPIACKPVKLLSRAASSEGLGFKVSRSARGMRRNLSFQPINGSIQSPLQEEANDVTSHHGALGPLVGTDFTRYSNGTNPDVTTPPPPTPTIEEALKIIHESECSNRSLCPHIGQNAFFLHPPESQSHAAAHSDLQDPEDDLSKARVNDGKLNSTSTDMDTGIHICTEDIQDGYDEESSLKDYSDLDQDYETRSCSLPNTGGSFSPAPSLKGQHSTSSIGSFVPVRMTNFAEQKSRKLNHVEGQSGGHTLETYICTPTARQVARSVTPDFQIQARSPRDPSSRLVSEMVQLKMKLEEKRRAIEGQKKKVEAVFTRHRQRMGRTAFLNVVHRKGTILPVEGGSCKRLDEEKNIQPQLLLTKNTNSQLEKGKPDWAPPKLTLVKLESAELVNLAEYTRSIERLNASLNFLQTEMQRLAQQQEHIMHVREQQAKVIIPSHMQTQTSLQKHLCERHSSSAVGRGSVGSLSPNLSTKGSPRSTQCSPALIKRKSASFHARTPRTPRSSDLKITPFSRMLNTAQSVDSLPRLRRFAPCQSQTSSFVYLGHDETPTDENHTNKEEVTALSVGSMNKQADTDADEISVDVLPNQVTEIQDEKEEKAKTNHLDIKEISSELLRPLKTTVAFEAQSETVRELLHVICTDSTGDGKDLIEVPISELEPMDNLKLESGKGTDCRLGKMCCGFFYRDDHKGEQDIAQKKAALMEKRLRREKEMKMKKPLLEGEMEQKKEMSRLKAEEDCQKKEEEEKARRELIKNEYLTRRQLKLMEDMDSIVKPRLPSIKQKKPRTKSMHRDIMVPKVPAQSHTGSRPQGYSVSSISLASLNLADSGNVHIDKRISRPEIIDGQLSLFPTANQNGEKWENESTSSAASNADYTGPKLYKEPSAKSNKYIIQNALSHCCLAGKVNEGQKNRILQEIEKTESRNFLILFRDPRCQFRSLYTYCLETEEISKLIGIGPKTIMPRMIENLYKYSSDKKQFCYIPAKTISASIDAITIYNHLWQTKKQSTSKKLLK